MHESPTLMYRDARCLYCDYDLDHGYFSVLSQNLVPMFVPITDPPGCVHGNCFEAYKRLRAENDERDRFLAQEDAEFDHERYQILNIPRPKVWSERHHGLIDAWTRPEGEHLDLPDDVWRLLAKHLVDEGGVSLFGNAGEVKWGQLTCGWNAVTTRWKPTRQCNLGNCGTLLARYVNRALWREMTRLMNERYEQWMERVHASERLEWQPAGASGTVLRDRFYNHPRLPVLARSEWWIAELWIWKMCQRIAAAADAVAAAAAALASAARAETAADAVAARRLAKAEVMRGETSYMKLLQKFEDRLVSLGARMVEVHDSKRFNMALGDCPFWALDPEVSKWMSVVVGRFAGCKAWSTVRNPVKYLKEVAARAGECWVCEPGYLLWERRNPSLPNTGRRYPWVALTS